MATQPGPAEDDDEDEDNSWSTLHFALLQKLSGRRLLQSREELHSCKD